MLRRAPVAIIAVCTSLLTGAMASGEPPARDPATTRPHTAPLLERLADPDPRVREAAQRSVIDLSLSDLEALRAELADRPAAPLPALKPPLKLALRHAHLRRAMGRYFAAVGLPPQAANDGEREENADDNGDAEPFDRERFVEPADGMPFLGVGNSVRAFRQQIELQERWEDDAGPFGYTVSSLVPGFVASTRLIEGDVVTGIAPIFPEDEPGHADAPPRARLLPVTGFSSLPRWLEVMRAGQRVRLSLLRGGRPMEVELVLDRRINTTSDLWLDLSEAALQEADAQWADEFEPLFAPPFDAEG